MSDDPNNPGNTPDDVNVKPPSGSQSQQVDWEARYKGLQRTYDKLGKDHDALKEKYDGLISETENARQDHRKVTSDLEALKASYQALENDKKAIENDLVTHRAQVDRTKTIMAEFADLAPFEAQGLLPSAANPDELKQKLEAFRKAMQDSVEKTATSKLQGYTPPSSGNQNPPAMPSKESVFAELQRLSGRRNPQEQVRYDELLSTWDELNK